MPIESVMPSAISSSVVPFSSCPQSLPASGSFPMSQLFAWGGPSTGVSAAAKSLQSCPTLCDPIEGSPTRLHHPWDFPGENTGVGCHFLLQCMKVKSVKSLSCVWLVATPWTAAYQALPSMGFSRQEYWSGVPLPSPREALRGTQLKTCLVMVKGV